MTIKLKVGGVYLNRNNVKVAILDKNDQEHTDGYCDYFKADNGEYYMENGRYSICREYNFDLIEVVSEPEEESAKNSEQTTVEKTKPITVTLDLYTYHQLDEKAKEDAVMWLTDYYEKNRGTAAFEKIELMVAILNSLFFEDGTPFLEADKAIELNKGK